MGNVTENLVYRIDVNILRGNEACVYLIDARTIMNVVGHAWNGGDIVHFQSLVGLELGIEIRFTGEASVGRSAAPVVVYLAQSLHHLEQSGTPRDAVSLERGRHGEANGLLGAAPVGHDKIGGEGV